jgi:hypothetical protein
MHQLLLQGEEKQQELVLRWQWRVHELIEQSDGPVSLSRDTLQNKPALADGIST